MPRPRKRRRQRRRGTGSVIRRPDLSYAYQLPRRLDSSRHTRYGYPNRESAVAALDAELARLIGATTALSGHESVRAFLARWLEHKARLRRAENTLVGYGSCLAKCGPIAALPLGEVRRRHIAELLAGLLADGLAVGTVQLVRRVLHAAFEDAVEWELIASNPVSTWKRSALPRTPRRQPKAWDKDEANRFLQTAAGHRLEALWRVALAVGPRLGELRGLRWDDVDLARGQLRIRRTIGREARTDGSTKTLEDRVVELPRPVVAALWRHRERAGDSPWVFAGPRGLPWSEPTIRADLEALAKAAGVPRLTVHSLRHSAATLMLDARIPLATVSEVLGHADPSVTAKIYYWCLPAHRRRAAQTMAEALP